MAGVMASMTREERIETIAYACHEANRAWSERHGEESLSWDQARESACRGVEVALSGATPEQQHEAWCEDRHASGWVHGAVKDPERLTHPCLVPYEQLPPYQRTKDALFIAIVRALAPALGLG